MTQNNIAPYRKAIIAALTALATILTGFGINAGPWGTSETIAALATIIGAVFVYIVPNKKPDDNA